MGQGNIFTLCVSPHLDGGGRVPLSQVRMGSTPFPGQDGGRGYPLPGQDGEGIPFLGQDGVTPPTGTGWFTPSLSGLDGGPPIKVGWGYPQSKLDGGTPNHPPPPSGDRETERLRGARYASCVHAGLSCS